jgi:hypothetical protein
MIDILFDAWLNQQRKGKRNEWLSWPSMDDNTRIQLLLGQIVHYKALIVYAVPSDGARFGVGHMGCAIWEDQIRRRNGVRGGGGHAHGVVVAMVAIHMVQCFFMSEAKGRFRLVPTVVPSYELRTDQTA